MALTIMPLEKTARQVKLYDPYKVLLHNDDNNDMGHVLSALAKAVPQLTEADAQAIMLEAHNSGVALVIACPLEHAEMYHDNLRSYGLIATIEKGD
jgi:ATP-dependent Clp protease adaptor protein ClpS